MAKRRGKKISRRTTGSNGSSTKSTGVIASKKKFSLVVNNLLIFVTIFVVSLGLYLVSSNEFYRNMFWMISLITGFLSVSLLLVFLIFVVLRYLGK